MTRFSQLHSKRQKPTCSPESKYISSLLQNFKIWNELPHCQFGQHCPDTFFPTRSVSFAQLSNGGGQRFGSHTRKKNQMGKEEKMDRIDLPVLVSLLSLPRQNRISSPQDFFYFSLPCVPMASMGSAIISWSSPAHPVKSPDKGV